MSTKTNYTHANARAHSLGTHANTYARSHTHAHTLTAVCNWFFFKLLNPNVVFLEIISSYSSNTVPRILKLLYYCLVRSLLLEQPVLSGCPRVIYIQIQICWPTVYFISTTRLLYLAKNMSNCTNVSSTVISNVWLHRNDMYYYCAVCGNRRLQTFVRTNQKTTA